MMSTAGSMRPPMSNVRATPGPAFGMVANVCADPAATRLPAVQPDPVGGCGRLRRLGRRRNGVTFGSPLDDQLPARLDHVRVRPPATGSGRCSRPAAAGTRSRTPARSPRASRRLRRCRSCPSAASPRSVMAGDGRSGRGRARIGRRRRGWREGPTTRPSTAEAAGVAAGRQRRAARTKPGAARTDPSV